MKLCQSKHGKCMTNANGQATPHQCCGEPGHKGKRHRCWCGATWTDSKRRQSSQKEG